MSSCQSVMLSKSSRAMDKKKTQEEQLGPINILPDELLLLIFQYIREEEILTIVAGVNQKWRQLSRDPSIWRLRELHYNARKPHLFRYCIKDLTEVKHLHLGDHEEVHHELLQAITESNLSVVRKLDFGSSCRTPPEKVAAVLQKLGPNLEWLAICLNDELVSYGLDKLTCYKTREALDRPGIIFGVLAEMENLRQLKLMGGYSPIWYYNELQGTRGCSKLEILDMNEFEEHGGFYRRNGNFIESLITKNKGHLKSLNIAEMSMAQSFVKAAILECKGCLQQLGINAAQIEGVVDEMPNLKSLHMNGRFFPMEKRKLQLLAKYIKNTSVLHNLEEFSLVCFNDPLNIILQAIARSCRRLKIFRSAGNALRGKGLTELIRTSPYLEELHLPQTDALAERHLVLAELYLPRLRVLDVTGIGFMDCMLSVRRLKKNSVQELVILGTRCDCSFPFDEGTVGEDSGVSDVESLPDEEFRAVVNN